MRTLSIRLFATAGIRDPKKLRALAADSSPAAVLASVPASILEDFSSRSRQIEVDRSHAPLVSVTKINLAELMVQSAEQLLCFIEDRERLPHDELEMECDIAEDRLNSIRSLAELICSDEVLFFADTDDLMG